MADILQDSGNTATKHEVSSEMGSLIQESIAYASAHGLLLASDSGSYIHAPFSLLPIPFPLAQFDKGIQLSPLYATLVDRVSRDLPWLFATLESVIIKDEFTRRLVDICQQVEAQGIIQKSYLGIHRSDYMLHDSSGRPPELLQVEMNTIASSFGCLSSIVCQMHQFTSTRFQTSFEPSTSLPANAALTKLPFALSRAHEQYLSQKWEDPSSSGSVIVFIVQNGETNSVDQRLLEYALWNSYGIQVLRKTLTQMHQEAVRLANHTLFLPQEQASVSVVYFRAGYTPKDYPSEKEWHARLTIEQSAAIKCPSIAYHLVGTKKVQQTLSLTGELEKFLPSSTDCTLVRSSFACLYGLERSHPSTAAIIEKVLANPDGYVMKPQREGGGNNLYGEEVRDALLSMNAEELESHILMSRITPACTPAILVRNGQPIVAPECTNELGMYSISLFDDGVPLLNEFAGHLLRTKVTSTNEGGVATGFAVLSSPCLI